MILFINGYYNTRDNYISRKIIGQKGGEDYWRDEFICSAMNYFSDINVGFIDGRGKFNSSGTERFNAGYLYAKNNFDEILSRLGEDDCVNIVSHSMGGAYAEGIVKYLQEQNIKIGEVVHFSPSDPGDITAQTEETYQLNIQNDIVLECKNFGESNIIRNVKRFGSVMTANSLLDDIESSHFKTKASSDVWRMLEDLKSIQIQYENSYSLYDSIPNSSGFSVISNRLTKGYSFSGNKNGYIFDSISINGRFFYYCNGEYLK